MKELLKAFLIGVLGCLFILIIHSTVSAIRILSKEVNNYNPEQYESLLIHRCKDD